jgi:hypothetical protein
LTRGVAEIYALDEIPNLNWPILEETPFKVKKKIKIFLGINS